MAEFEFTLIVNGDVQLKRAFSRFAEDIKDASEPFREIAADFHEIERLQFGSEGGYGSGGWLRLSPNYAAWKAKVAPGAPILVFSGLLRESLVDGNPYTIEDIQPLELRLGTRVPYAWFHQWGTRKMPRRRPVDLTEEDKKRWTNIFHRWLVKQANKDFKTLAPAISSQEKHLRSIGRE